MHARTLIAQRSIHLERALRRESESSDAYMRRPIVVRAILECDCIRQAVGIQLQLQQDARTRS